MFENLPEDLKELEWKISDLEDQVLQYRDLVDRRPIFVVGYKYEDKSIKERKYIGIFSTEELAIKFF